MTNKEVAAKLREMYNLNNQGIWSCDYEALSVAIDLLESNILKLPCAVGDTVYKIWYHPCHNGEDYPDSYRCCGCEDECDIRRDVFPVVMNSIEQILSSWGNFKDGFYYLNKEDAYAEMNKS